MTVGAICQIGCSSVKTGEGRIVRYIQGASCKNAIFALFYDQDVTVHTPWQPTGFCRVSTADKVAPKGVSSMGCALKPEKGCWLSRGEVNDYIKTYITY
ncbi:MAG: hypothetical protein C4B58_14620 [Deltaproteobacteria bacterium]|nr:MAG: hypothetical protein C4B58_14620 [Deltaproteobacteria bacterium]